MVTNFSPSINILRDIDKDVYYVPTPNSKEIYNQISKQFKSGVHSFNLIGSYGTGKSAFLLALAKHLNQEATYFSPVNGQFNKCKKFNFLNIVGEFASLIESFAGELETEATSQAILKDLQLKHKNLKKDTCLVIVIDEFGKFLEYAAKHNPDAELYFVQQLAEFANNKKTNVLFISVLHQNFDAYATGLTKSQKAEWEKVKGRIKELTFNEPIEQLLHLVTEFLEDKFTEGAEVKFNKELVDSIQETGAFNLLTDINKEFAESLYPFDLLSAMVLTKGLQEYGQNERSLFHFLHLDEKHGLYDYDKDTNPYYNLSCIYDYLQYNYYRTLASKDNFSRYKWSLLRNSLDRVRLELTDHIEGAEKIIKTIGLLNILGANVAKINDALLLNYGKHALGLQNTEETLNLLLKKKILRYQKYNDQYKLFEGTDIDIDELIEDKKRALEPIVDLIAELKGKFNLGIIPAKAVTYKTGTPRFFEFRTSTEPIETFKVQDRSIDGFINLIFRENAPLKVLKKVTGEPILYGVYQNTTTITALLEDIKVVDLALVDIGADKVAKAELVERRDYHINALNEAINKELFDNEEKIKWYFNGDLVKIDGRRSFNKQLSLICERLYPATPIFKNELMNKQNPSRIINTSKKYYFKELLENYSKPQLDFTKDKYPAEKTIYQTLLNDTGIHVSDPNGIYAYFTEKPTNASFLPLWEASKDFLESAKIGKRFISEFVDTLRAQPFNLKDGFIEFWVGTFLFIHREEFALFGDAYIPSFSTEVLELLFKYSHKYQIKTFNVEGVRLALFNKYRALIEVSSKEKVTNSGFKETAAPFLMFYKQLPLYTKKTDRLSKATNTFRNVISKAKELEKTFFEDLPSAFGVTLEDLHQSNSQLELFVEQIQGSIRELRMTLSILIDRVEAAILDILGLSEEVEFEEYTVTIKKRYNNIKEHLLLPHQKVFYNRIFSEIEDKENWIKNVVHAVLGKKIEDITDQDEIKIYEKLNYSFQELDDLVALNKDTINEDEEVIRVKLSGVQKKPLSKNIIITKKQQKAVSKLEKALTEMLSKDDKINQAALVNLLKKYM
ncbi:MAG: hypothetical protein ACRBFS_14065 [Aureispira sp.]